MHRGAAFLTHGSPHMSHVASAAIAAQRAEVRAWLRELMKRHSVEVKDIAARSGVSAMTIYRILDENGVNTPSLGTIARIAKAYGDALPGGDQRTAGFAEGDVTRFAGEPPSEALKPQSPNQSMWRLNNRALELSGLLPGDYLLMDMSQPPRAGDIVIAQIYDFEAGGAVTRIRRYDGVYLTTSSMDPGQTERPLPVDGERVVLMGRVIRSMRNFD